jgi:hypothetical protein
MHLFIDDIAPSQLCERPPVPELAAYRRGFEVISVSLRRGDVKHD